MSRRLSDRPVFTTIGDSGPQPEGGANRLGDIDEPKQTLCPDPEADGAESDALAQWMTALNAMIDVPVPDAPVAGGGTLMEPEAGEVSPSGERAGRGTVDPFAFRSNQAMEYNVTQAQFVVPVCYETEANPSRIAVAGATDALTGGTELRNASDDLPGNATPVTTSERLGTDATDRMALNVSPALESHGIPQTVSQRVDSRRPGVANASFSSWSRDMPVWQTSRMNMMGADALVPRAERGSAEPVPPIGEMLPDVIEEPALGATQQAVRAEAGVGTLFLGERDAVTHLSTERWGPQLMSALGERIDVHTRLGVERAIIRLDPQSMGTLQIEIRRDGGALQIQFIASHEDVARQLSEVSYELRQQLEGRQHCDVSVVVRHGHGLGHGGASPDDDADTPESEKLPGAALAEADVGYADAGFHLDESQWKFGAHGG